MTDTKLLGPRPLDRLDYLPIILTRQGERLALRETKDSVKDRISPLFVVHPIDLDPGTRAPKRSVDQHLEKLAVVLVRDWGTRPAFVDLRHLDPSVRMSDGRHPTAWFIARCADLGLILAPALSMTHAPEYRAAAAAVASDLGTNAMLRLGPDDWPEMGTPLGQGRLLQLLADSRRDPPDVHIVLDAEEIGAAPNIVAAAMRPALASLPHAPAWASLIVAGTGMPVGTAEIGRDKSAEIPRTEWQLWRMLEEGSPRQLSFGDYCVQHPDPVSDFNPLFMDSSAQLRYTIPSAWFIARGSGVKKTGNQQIRSLARMVVNHDHFAGSDFSWGDNWLWMCSKGNGSPGNQGVWRKVTTNHHLAFAVNQIANQFGQ